MTAGASGSADQGPASAPSGSQFVTAVEAQQAAEHPTLARTRECRLARAAAGLPRRHLCCFPMTLCLLSSKTHMAPAPAVAVARHRHPAARQQPAGAESLRVCC